MIQIVLGILILAVTSTAVANSILNDSPLCMAKLTNLPSSELSEAALDFQKHNPGKWTSLEFEPFSGLYKAGFLELDETPSDHYQFIRTFIERNLDVLGWEKNDLSALSIAKRVSASGSSFTVTTNNPWLKYSWDPTGNYKPTRLISFSGLDRKLVSIFNAVDLPNSPTAVVLPQKASVEMLNEKIISHLYANPVGYYSRRYERWIELNPPKPQDLMSIQLSIARVHPSTDQIDLWLAWKFSVLIDQVHPVEIYYSACDGKFIVAEPQFND